MPARNGAGPHVLVVVATRHGATEGIAEAITRDLPATEAGSRVGLTAVVQRADHDPNPAGADAIVLGSAVYAGRWLEPAREYVSRHATVLRERPVWLFSSGPIGDPPFPPDEPHDVHPLVQLIGARGHRVFAGRLDKALLSWGERAMVTAMRAPLGDFRDWAAVRAWSEEIATALADQGSG